jgi:hypothetical protein
MYHDLPRHLSRRCFADFAADFDDKLISPSLHKILKDILKGLPFSLYFLSVPHEFL